MFEKILTKRATPVVTPEQLAAFARFDLPTQFDTASPPKVTEDYQLLLDYIEAATDHVETIAAVSCITEEMLLTFDFFPGQQDPRQMLNYQLGQGNLLPWWWLGFPTRDSIELVRRPVQDGSTASPPTLLVQYMDADGNLQSFDPSNYEVFADKITLLPGKQWPRTAHRQDVVRITYPAGYGDTPNDVPAKLKQAIKFLAAHFYENRVPVGTEPTSEVEFTLTEMLYSFRSMRIPR